ncbi:MAG: flagellar hook-length control protein FliK [Thermincola sp.]|nr:flagellar hook-length control protein FliK [Thermincola sp.]MDT3701790.1 flagellar hook-length control protein FliK [Thermincola sp.]
MQAVPFMAFTAKPVETGNSTKPVRSSSYGSRSQTRQPAFARTFEQAARELKRPSGTDPGQQKPETLKTLDSNTAPASVIAIHDLTQERGDLQEIMAQLQEILQQLGLNINAEVDSPGQLSEILSVIPQELLAGLNLTGHNIPVEHDFLSKLADALAKLDPEQSAAILAKLQAVVEITTAGETSATGETVKNQHLTSEHDPGLSAEAGERAKAGRNSVAGSFGKFIGQREVRAAGDKQPEADSPDTGPFEPNLGEAKITEATLNEARQAKTGTFEGKLPEKRLIEFKQAELGPSEAKSVEIQQGNQGEGSEKTLQLNMKGQVVLANTEGEPAWGSNTKIPEPPVSVPRITQVIFSQITQKARLLVSPGTTKLQIQLKPDFLGKMNLSITSENGLVTAKFNTESYRVKEVIEANLNTLKDSLAQQGIKVDQLVVNVNTQKDYSGHQQQNPQYYRNSGRQGESARALNEAEFEKVFLTDLEARNTQAYYGNSVDFKA